MYCHQCAHELPPGARFCPRCAAEQPGLQQGPPPATAPPPQPAQTQPFQPPLPGPVLPPPAPRAPAGMANRLLGLFLVLCGAVRLIQNYGNYWRLGEIIETFTQILRDYSDEGFLMLLDGYQWERCSMLFCIAGAALLIVGGALLLSARRGGPVVLASFLAFAVGFGLFCYGSVVRLEMSTLLDRANAMSLYLPDLLVPLAASIFLLRQEKLARSIRHPDTPSGPQGWEVAQ